MAVENTNAPFDMVAITTVKGFIVQATSGNLIKLFLPTLSAE
jgi:hypothetical protein